MSNDISELKEQYRRVKAPAALAARVRAAVDEAPQRGSLWMPATATVFALALLAGILPLLMDVPDSQPAATDKQRRPSLSALATMMPKKPPGRSTSLARLRTISKPKMPSKPVSKEPQANNPNNDEIFKEKTHVLI